MPRFADGFSSCLGVEGLINPIILWTKNMLARRHETSEYKHFGGSDSSSLVPRCADLSGGSFDSLGIGASALTCLNVPVNLFTCVKTYSPEQNIKPEQKCRSNTLKPVSCVVLALRTRPGACCESVPTSAFGNKQRVSYQLVKCSAVSGTHRHTPLCVPGSWAGSHCLKILADMLCLI